jgi:betaine-aldehyde dehydrogenase
MFLRSALFINNRWCKPPLFRKVFNPATKECIHYYPAAGAAEVDSAVKAAHKAFASWSQTTAAARATFLNAIADAIDAKAELLARLESTDNGKAISEARFDIGDSAACFRFYAKEALELEKKQDVPVELADKSYSSRVRYEPVGVAGMIIPWNYPFLMVKKE